MRERIEDEGGHAAVVRCDVSQPSDVRSAIEQVAVTRGTLDVLVNSAGIGMIRAVADASEEEFDLTLATTASGTPWASGIDSPRCRRS